MSYKQIILVRKDLKLDKGKLAAQVSHASTESALRSNKKILQSWREQGMKKVILKVEDEKELLEFKTLASRKKLINALIKDAGRTRLKPGTITCLGIGPDKEEKIDLITGKLKLL